MALTRTGPTRSFSRRYISDTTLFRAQNTFDLHVLAPVQHSIGIQWYSAY
jgi:hypothetical protein